MPRPESNATPTRAILVLLLAAALSACDLGTTPDTRFMAGEWLAVELVAQDASDPSVVDTLIPNGRWFRYMSFGHGGYHEVNTWSPEGHWTTDAGRWISNDSVVTVRYAEADTQYWHYEAINDNRARVIIPGRLHDLDGDSVAELANEIVEMVRGESNPAAEVLGSWVADAYTFRSVADTTVTYDVIGDGGSFSISMFQSATYQSSETIPGGSGTQSTTGELAAADGLIWLMYGSSSVQAGTYTVGTDTLIMEFEDAAWDFDDDGTEEPATLRFELHKS